MTTPVPTRFDDAFAELQQIVARLEAPDASVDDLEPLLARAKQLEDACRSRLAAVQARVTALTAAGAATAPGVEDSPA